MTSKMLINARHSEEMRVAILEDGILQELEVEYSGREEIKAWINENIDFAEHKNPMQAIGTIMKHFGKMADGNIVKSVLQELSIG